MEKELRLLVSYNCGISYEEEAKGNLERLKKLAKKFDKEGLRWVIEDKFGDAQALCPAHRCVCEWIDTLPGSK